MLEVRSTGELRSNGKTLTGYAAIFNSETDLGSFVEVIRNGAFRKSLEGGANIRALYHHQGDALLGTTRGGTLKLREDAKGLAFDLALPDTTHGRDLAILVDRGDVAGCSFGFKVREGGDFVSRAVELGVRGTARSQVLEGLAPGDEVLLSAGGDAGTVLKPGEPPQGESDPADDGTQQGEAQ